MRSPQARDGGACHNTPFALWRCGELTLVGLPGEPVAEYVPLIERAIGNRPLWIAGYCNDTFFYLPTRAILAEGGFESRGLYEGPAARFAPAVEDRVLATVTALLAPRTAPP